MKHPISSSKDRLLPEMLYSDIHMSYPIGDVVRYWTKLLIDNKIRLDKIDVDENGWDGDSHRVHHKTFPWAVDIIYMYSKRIPDLYKKDCYKINFNLECIDGVFGYNLTEKEKEYISNLFKGNWLNYLDIQGYRIIVQFWLEDYYPIFRKEKILYIKKNLLSL